MGVPSALAPPVAPSGEAEPAVRLEASERTIEEVKYDEVHHVSGSFSPFKNGRERTMKSTIFFRLGLPIAVLSGLWVAGPARGADHKTPLTSTPKRVYPSGANISQRIEMPDAGTPPMLDAAAAPGRVSVAAAMHNLMAHPRTRTRVQQQLTPVLKSQAQIQLSAGNGNAVALTSGAGPAIAKFTYSYSYKGVPLWRYSSQSQLIHVKNGTRKLLITRERNIPNLDQLGETEPTVKTDDATKLGVADSRDAAGAEVMVDAAVEPPHREIHVDAQGKSTLAWAFVIRSTERKQPFARRYWVAATGEPKIMTKEDLIYHDGPADDADADADAAHKQGRVTGNFFGFKKSPLDPPAKKQGLGNLQVGTTPGGTAIITDANGFFSSVPGMQLHDRLNGPFCAVVNDAGAPLTASKSGLKLFFNATSQQALAQVSAFMWVSNAHAFVADFVRNNDDRLRSLPTHVNIDETCNAFFDPNEHTLNFFKAGDDCVNSAYCDVASHEFGHAVDDQFGDILDGGYSEGFGDSLAILITHDSVIGRDFQGKGTTLRDAKEIHTWPPQDPEVHEVGKIYGGFTWELAQQLISNLGSEDKGFAAAKQLVLGAAAMNPKDTPDAVRLSFLIDHQNGSPYFKELAAAADSRKIPRPKAPADLDDPHYLSAGHDR
jgi:hypothetical protein